MEKMLVDNEMLGVTLPDGFCVVSLEDLQAAYGMRYPNMWGVRDDERHIALNVIWKDSGEMLTRLASEKSLAKRNEKVLSKAYRSSGYRCDGFFSRELAGRESQGFRCSYQVDGISQICESMVFKCGKRCYTLYYYTRPELAKTNQSTYEAILSSLQLG